MTAYLKTKTIHQDWLSALSGSTVQQAIAYLSTLNQDHTLSCFMEGDTHGCDIVAILEYQVPMTNAEILAMLTKKYEKEIKLYADALEKHLKRPEGLEQRIKNCNTKIEFYTTKLAEAQAKYG